MVRPATFVLLASLFAVSTLSVAQPRRGRIPAAAVPAPPPAITTTKSVHPLVPPLSFDRIGASEGLPNSHVLAIVQDKRGFVWFGTQDGLARYDGARMKVYRPIENDPTSVSETYITALTLDGAGNMWVGTAESGANLYDPETDRFTRFKAGTPGGLSSAGVTAILRDKKDRMWFAMADGGLNRFEPETKTFKAYQSDPLAGVITALDVDAAGALWLGTAEGLVRWNPDDGSTAAYPLDDGAGAADAPVTEIRVASSGLIWIGTDGGGLVSFDPKSLDTKHYRNDPAVPTSISDDHITVLYEDKDKSLWAGTINGLNRFDAKGAAFRYHHDPADPKSLAFDGVESMFQDAGGVMWFGGFTLGVCKHDEIQGRFGRARTRTFTTTTFSEDADGSIWIGTDHGGLYHYEEAAQRYTLYSSLGAEGGAASLDLTSAWITALHRDRKGTLWISLRGQGLVAFDTRSETYRHYVPSPDAPNSLPVDTVFSMWDDEQGRLWIASWGGGLVTFEPSTEAFSTITTEDQVGLTSDHLYTLYPDPLEKNLLWIGTGKGGLVRFDRTAGKATSFRHVEGDATSISSDHVLSIYRDPKGIVWAGTYGGGLNRLDVATGKFQRFTTSNSGLSNDMVLGVLNDNEGGLWMSTNGGGLVQLSPDGKTFTVHDVSDGVQGKEFAQGSYMRTRAGRMFFGGMEGFNSFLPKDIQPDTYVPPVTMTGFKVFNEDVTLAKPIWTIPSIKVSYADSFEIQFAALSFAAPGRNRYAYKLEGYDDHFTETDRPYVTYNKVDGGNYTLRIRAANRHGTWNETGVALKIKVTPPIWRTWPAYIVYLLLLVGAAVLLVYIQRERVRRVEREGRLAVVERDLALTGAVQNGFLPDVNEVHGERVQLFGFYRGADTCSGDWWWHENLPGHHAVLVGDVTGHGPGPAMVTAAVSTAFRVLTENGLSDMREALEILNRVVLQVAKGKYSMTMAALELNEHTGAWVLYSAGAPPMMSVGKSGKHRTHFCAGSPLGTETGFEPGRLEGKLEPNERILIYTDGIPEIMLANGQALGMRRVGQMFEGTLGQDLRVSASSIVKQADLAQAGKPQDDDWTFAIVEWRGSQRAAG